MTERNDESPQDPAVKARAGSWRIDELPSPLAVPMDEYLREAHPVLKLWRACDILELTLRLAVALGIGDAMQATGRLPEKVVRACQSQIELPTLGKWVNLASVVSELPLEDCFPELPSFVQSTLLPVLSGPREGATERSSLLSLRNRLAHGGGVSRGLAQTLLDAWSERLDATFAAHAWLTRVTLVARSGDGSFVAMVGPSGRHRPFVPPSAQLTTSLEGCLTRARVAAVRDVRAVPVWPLATFGAPPRTEATDETPLPELTMMYVRRGPVSLQYMPVGSETVAQADGDPEAMLAFRELFQLDARDQRALEGRFVVRDFSADIRRDAARLVGRASELGSLVALARCTPRGVIWVSGAPGIGKSYLMAATAVQLLGDAESKGSGEAHPEVLAYRFRGGDERCSRERFLTFAVERLRVVPGADRKPGSAHAPASSAAALMQELRAELKRLAGSRIVLLLDGLDEIAESDPRFADEIPLSIDAPELLWVCAGRPERVLTEAFRPDRCIHAFGASSGVQRMGAGDIRSMVIERIGPMRQKLLTRDREIEGEAGVDNPFIARIAERADGLPLYVTHVIGDILSGRIRSFEPTTPLPRGLTSYQDQLLDRCHAGAIASVSTAIIGLLAVAREPLSFVQLLEAISPPLAVVPTPLILDRDRARRHLEHALSVTAPLLERAQTPEDAEAFRLNHHSLRQRILESEATRDIAEAQERVLATLCAAVPGPDEQPFLHYAVRHGSVHLCAAGRFADGVRLLDGLYALSKTGKTPGVASQLLQRPLRQVALEIGRCPAAEAARINPQALGRLAMELSEFDLVKDLVRVLRRDHRSAWPEVVAAAVDAGAWTCSYAVADVLAESIQSRADDDSELRAWLEGTDLVKREMGLYVLRLLYAHFAVSAPERIDLPFLQRLAIGSGSLSAGVVAEALLVLAFRGVDVSSLLRGPPFLDPTFAYTRTLVADVHAALRFRGCATKATPTIESEAQAALAAWRQADADRRRLLEDVAIQAHAPLVELLKNYFDLTMKRELLRECEPVLRGAPERVVSDVLGVLFSNPYWDVREMAAGVLAAIADDHPALRSWAEASLNHADWHVRYAALDAVYFWRADDQAMALGRAFAVTSRDDCAWIRGLCGNLLHLWLGDEPADTRGRAMQQKEVIRRLTRDLDTWPLYGVRDLFARLKDDGVDFAGFLDPDLSPFLRMIPDWWTIPRYKFLRALDAVAESAAVPSGDAAPSDDPQRAPIDPVFSA